MKSDLSQAVQVASRSVSSKPGTPILSGIYLCAKDDTLEVQATDFSLGVIIKIKADVDTQGETVVSGKYLQEVVRALPDDEVAVTYDRASKLIKISSGYSNFNLLSMNADDYPKINPIDGEHKFVVKSPLLKELIRRTAFACGVDEERPVFMGALLEIENDSIRMVATNIHRMSCYEGKLEESGEGKFQYIVPKRVLEEIQHIMTGEIPENVIICATKSEIIFKTERFYLSSRLIEGTFPDYEKAIPKEFATRVTLSSSVFTSAIGRVGLIARSSDYNTIRLIFNMGEVHISSDNPIVGRAEETVTASIDGDDIKISFNAAYLMDVMKVIGSDEFVLHMNTPIKTAVISETENENYLYVVTPLRTKD